MLQVFMMAVIIALIAHADVLISNLSCFWPKL